MKRPRRQNPNQPESEREKKERERKKERKFCYKRGIKVNPLLKSQLLLDADVSFPYFSFTSFVPPLLFFLSPSESLEPVCPFVLWGEVVIQSLLLSISLSLSLYFSLTLPVTVKCVASWTNVHVRLKRGWIEIHAHPPIHWVLLSSSFLSQVLNTCCQLYLECVLVCFIFSSHC